jgi:hypothetical protein
MIVISVAACHKKQPEAPPTQSAETAGTTHGPDQPQAQTAAKPLPPPPAVVAANADNYVRANVTGQPDPFLTQQLRGFISKYGRLPESFAEFKRQSLDSMPTPPEGTKWVIDSSDSQVKSVPR